jgi:hypothetical protein
MALQLPRDVVARDGNRSADATEHMTRVEDMQSAAPGDSRKTDLIPFDKLEAFFTENLAPGARVGKALAASVA